MGVEFYEEKPAAIPSAAAKQQGGLAGSLVSAGLTKSITGAQMTLAVFGILSLFGAYLVFSLGKKSGANPPTRAEVQAMADLLKK